MINYFFHKCEMRHEEFHFCSSIPEISAEWKRNALCSHETRSKNIFCTHGSAVLQLKREMEENSPELLKNLVLLQNQLFALDHLKGDLEKYVLEEDSKKKDLIKVQLTVWRSQYHLICNQIQALLSESQFFKPEKPQNQIDNSTFK